MSRDFQPIVSSTHDGADLTLCKILEATAAGGALTTGFAIPAYNDVVFQNNGNGDPTEITFKLNGTPVYYLAFTYDGNGYLTRIQQD